MLRRTDLNLIPALCALLDQRHVTRAAETLGIGQPAMSAALARLRRIFDDPLLVRRGRTLELTPLGQALVEPVHDVLAGLEHLLTTTPAFDPTTDHRSFTIAASDYVTLVLLQPLLADLNRQAPKLEVNVVPVNLSTPSAVERAQIDLAIVPTQTMNRAVSHLHQRRLFTRHIRGHGVEGEQPSQWRSQSGCDAAALLCGVSRSKLWARSDRVRTRWFGNRSPDSADYPELRRRSVALARYALFWLRAAAAAGAIACAA